MILLDTVMHIHCSGWFSLGSDVNDSCELDLCPGFNRQVCSQCFPPDQQMTSSSSLTQQDLW